MEDNKLYEFIMSDILEGNKTNNDESKDKNDYNNETSMKIHAREKPCQCKQCEKDFIDITLVRQQIILTSMTIVSLMTVNFMTVLCQI